MEKTVNVNELTSIHLSQLVQMAQLLINQNLMTKKEVEITLQRITLENELSPIYF